MSRRQKRFAKIKRSPHDVDYDKLAIVLQDFGFIEGTGDGDHVGWIHRLLPGVILTIDSRGKHRPLDTGAVKAVLRKIDEVSSLIGDE